MMSGALTIHICMYKTKQRKQQQQKKAQKMATHLENTQGSTTKKKYPKPVMLAAPYEMNSFFSLFFCN